MGYDTRHKIEAPAAAIESFLETCEEAACALDGDGSTREPAKWYEAEADLAALSKSFPDDLIVLHGLGEGDGDVDTWRIYAKGGSTHRVEPTLVWPDPPEGWKPSLREVEERRRKDALMMKMLKRHRDEIQEMKERQDSETTAANS